MLVFLVYFCFMYNVIKLSATSEVMVLCCCGTAFFFGNFRKSKGFHWILVYGLLWVG